MDVAETDPLRMETPVRLLPCHTWRGNMILGDKTLDKRATHNAKRQLHPPAFRLSSNRPRSSAMRAGRKHGEF